MGNGQYIQIKVAYRTADQASNRGLELAVSRAELVASMVELMESKVELMESKVELAASGVHNHHNTFEHKDYYTHLRYEIKL